MEPNNAGTEATLAVAFAVFGMVAIGLGSLLAGAAPSDGQTGMVVFPLWLIGAVLGCLAIARAASGYASRNIWIAVAVCALVSIGSVAWSIAFSIQSTSGR